MFTQSYTATINFLATISPDLPITAGKTTNFFPWVEDMAGILEFVYSCNYEDAVKDLVDAVKEHQDYEDEDEGDADE